MEISHGEHLTLRVGGGQLSARAWGSGGQSVLCLHAAGHSSADFAALAARVGRRLRLYALDWPGHGHSPGDGGRACAHRYADLALHACDSLNLTRPIIIGNSIGGAAAIIAAFHAPEKVSALVLCNPGGLAPIDAGARLAIAGMAAFFAAGAHGATWYPAAFAAYYRHLVLPAHAATRRREAIIAQATELAPLLADAWCGFAEPRADLRAMAAQLSLPVWCAWARGDRLVSWGRSKAAVRRIPQASWSFFRGGHTAFLEDPDRFAASFLAFAAPGAAPGAAVRCDR